MKHSREPVVIHRWKRTDLDYVANSITREGWGHSIRDVERCWRLERRGCFLAVVRSVPVGHVFSVCFGKLGWIGLLIVDPGLRGQGVGSVLMDAAVSYLQQAGCKAIRLEAAEKAVPLYRRFGFRKEFDSLRFRGQVRSIARLGRLERGIRKMGENDVVDVARFDERYFGADRKRVLRGLLLDSPALCYVAEDDTGIVGYAMARRIGDGFWVGPLVCQSLRRARFLFDVLAEAVSGFDVALRVGLPAVNVDGGDLLEKLGFQLTGKSIRMVRGSVEQGQGDATCVFGIGGPEKG